MNTVEQTLQMLMFEKRNHWIIRSMPLAATENQTPKDLIVAALRSSGFDFYASNSKANEIIDNYETTNDDTDNFSATVPTTEWTADTSSNSCRP